jgi:hypothetical protein
MECEWMTRNDSVSAQVKAHPEAEAPQPPQIAYRRIAAAWWPLALSWLLMSVEGPAHSAIVARLANPEINLAAWGGIVFPISLIVEAPVVMLLSASTALSKDWRSYVKVRRIAITTGVIFTALHGLIAFTPLYPWVARTIIGAPEAIIEPARIGLMIMTPWTLSIAYRRFQQGAMIRFGHSKAVGIGTAVRLIANGLILTAGYLLKRVPGIVVASTAVATGVIAEAIYAGLRIRPIARQQIRSAPRVETPLTFQHFLAFYIPLALTSLISFFISPIGSASMSRMPRALSSLAAWPVIYGFIFVMRSPCLAYNEVTVALLDESRSYPRLKRFAGFLALSSTLLILLVAATPLAEIWMRDVMALPTDLLPMATRGVWFIVPLPLLALIQSWFQAIIVHDKKTRAITEAVALNLVTFVIIAGISVMTQAAAGLYVVLLGQGIAGLMQALWLWLRSRSVVKRLEARDGGNQPSGPISNASAQSL